MAVAASKPRGVTSFAFITSNERAEAIETVAERRPDDEIKATVTAITDRDSAQHAFDRKGEGEIPRIFDPDPESVRKTILERYIQVGEAGMSSLVEVEVPGGNLAFDFPGFYAEVNEVAPSTAPGA